MSINNSDVLLKKRDEYIYDICSFIAKLVIESEVKLYKKIPEGKKEILKQDTIKKAVDANMADTIKQTLKDIPDSVTKLTDYFGVEKLNLLKLMLVKYKILYSNLDRKSLNIEKNESEYTTSVAQIINEAINEMYSDIFTTFIQDLENVEDDC